MPTNFKTSWFSYGPGAAIGFFTINGREIQADRSSLAKHGGAYFSAIYGFMKDLIAAPGPYENQEV